MCGIAGIHAYHYAAPAVDRSEVLRIRDRMIARGPDGEGLWHAPDGRTAFGHRRLSIIDLSEAGAQPMASTDGKLIVTFNGEIYNHRALRRELEAKGSRFRGQCDTEVLLHLYAEKGERMLDDLRGMFAFAIWDAERRRLLIARDPYGIKPLYYADDGWTFRFASQVKALLAGGGISREREPAGVVGFHLWGSVPEPFTTHRDIRALPAGSYLLVDRIGPATPVTYHSIAEVYGRAATRRHPMRPEARQEAIRDALRDSVRHHLESDVPVGAFLSAGICSGSLLGLMHDIAASEVQTITLAFEEFRGETRDEAPLAADVARLYGARHMTRVVTEDEFRADLPNILNAMDQPTIDGINAWFVAKAARELGLKVAVSGLGGDELFGGYPSFRDIPLWVRSMTLPSRAPLLGRLSRRLAVMLRPDRFGLSPKIAGMVEFGGTYAGAYMLRRGLFMPWELEQVLDRELAREGLRRLNPLAAVGNELRQRHLSPLAKVAVLESALYMRNQLLRDADWASMAHSVEVRAPLVDAVLLRDMARLGALEAGAGDKAALARSPTKPLPRAIVSRPKTGFTTPVATWLDRTAFVDRFAATPALAKGRCHWARRWAYGVAAA